MLAIEFLAQSWDDGTSVHYFDADLYKGGIGRCSATLGDGFFCSRTKHHDGAHEAIANIDFKTATYRRWYTES